MSTPSLEQLKRAVEISEQIAELKASLASILDGTAAAATEAPQKVAAVPMKVTAKAAPLKKEGLTPEARARISAATTARWDKFRAEKTATAKSKSVSKSISKK